MHFLRGCLLLPPTLLLWVAAEFPEPPVQTDVQKAVVRTQAAKAEAASKAATAHVLDLFDSELFRVGLKKCCPHVAELSALQLLERLREEVRAAELAHAFPSGFTKGFFTDLTIPLADRFGWFLNQWQAPIVQNKSADGFFNLAEENIFGCPPFKNDSNPTWDEAADRMIYVAHNLRQLDSGSDPFFGDATAIFHKPYVQDMVLIAAVDTGFFEVSCNASATGSFPGPPPLKFDCDSWAPPIVGTLQHFDHVILSNLGVWAKAFNSTAEERAVNLFTRSAFAGNYLDLPKVGSLEATQYYESNILGNPRFPEGISFLIGSFHTLFGTDGGRELQQLADRFSWPLVWALGAKPEAPTHGNSRPHRLLGGVARGPKGHSFAGNQRFLDPSASGSRATNASVPSAAMKTFAQVWNKVAQRRKVLSPIHTEQWLQWWYHLVNSQVRLAPLTAQAGCSDHACIGTIATSGDCVCKRRDNIVV